MLIPPRPSKGCPRGTIDGVFTCFCEDHCSWDMCRLNEPPELCLENTFSSCDSCSSWEWDSIRNYWTAQGIWLTTTKLWWTHIYFIKTNECYHTFGKYSYLISSAIWMHRRWLSWQSQVGKPREGNKILRSKMGKHRLFSTWMFTS